jgi:hypothetical protein
MGSVTLRVTHHYKRKSIIKVRVQQNFFTAGEGIKILILKDKIMIRFLMHFYKVLEVANNGDQNVLSQRAGKVLLRW